MLAVKEFRTSQVKIPQGEDRAAILDALAQTSIDGSSSVELRNYVNADLDRFLYTLALVPEHASGRGLEIGANPYFMSTLLREYRPGLAFDYVNYFEGTAERAQQEVSWRGADAQVKSDTFAFYNINLEENGLPLDDQLYDVILFCEVLEHFTMNPLRCVRELGRLLKEDGVLILTTPNVARYENVVALLEGRNLYDPYSGYGPHGRHNREYSRHELHMLMQHAGFTCETDFTSDVHTNIPSSLAENPILRALGMTSSGKLNALLGLVPGREHDLGQYLFSRWRKVPGAGSDKFPSWLYRSYAAELMA